MQLTVLKAPREAYLIACLWRRDEVASMVAGILGTTVDPEQSLMEAGVDSLGAVDLRNALMAHYNLELPATATFDFPTVAAMAQHIVASMATSNETAPIWQDNAVVEHVYGPPTSAAVQIVGLSCTYPGQC